MTAYSARRPDRNGTCGSSASNPTSIFRIGTDGLTAPLPAASPTLPQPFYPGVNGIAAAVGVASDPNFRPNVVDSFTLTFARQLTTKISVEMGYIGRLIHHESPCRYGRTSRRTRVCSWANPFRPWNVSRNTRGVLGNDRNRLKPKLLVPGGGIEPPQSFRTCGF